MRSRLDRLCRTAAAALVIAVGAGAGCGSSAPKDNGRGGAGGGVSCSQSIAAYCAQNSCFATWTDAQAVAAACQANTPPYMTLSCGAYLALYQFFGDGSETAYYDAATGELVAVAGFSANTGLHYCYGGPAAGFAAPNCDAADAGAALDCGAPDGIVQ